jgi:hypothetical protein
VILLLIVALLDATLGVARVLTIGDGPTRRATAPESPATTFAVAPPTSPPAPVAAPPTPPGNPTAGAAGAGATVVEPDAPVPVDDPPATKPAAPVICESDLALEDAPDAPYNFLCVQGDIPLSWPNDRIRLYASGLSPEQSAALQTSLPQWEAQGRFDVTVVDTPSNANVTIAPGDLHNSEDGHTLVHYTCAATCAFDHVDIELSSARELTKPVWVTTILHELAHAAGLNHVSRKTQVMYPDISLVSPATYADGDIAGLQALARIRAS